MSTWQDAVNGSFELVGGFAVLLHCWKLYKDKQIKGVSWLASLFFTLWGYWNLYYYPHLEQWLSLFGGTVIVAGNTMWVAMMLYYMRKNNNERVRNFAMA
jgi:hypothetical protein